MQSNVQNVTWSAERTADCAPVRLFTKPCLPNGTYIANPQKFHQHDEAGLRSARPAGGNVHKSQNDNLTHPHIKACLMSSTKQ